MGQHTWFYKNKDVYDKANNLWLKVDAHERGEEWVDDLELCVLIKEIDKLEGSNYADYHDVFRTWKRNEDGTYTDDVITSYKEMIKWFEENSDKHDANEKALKELKKFWDEHPDGVIDFG